MRRGGVRESGGGGAGAGAVVGGLGEDAIVLERLARGELGREGGRWWDWGGDEGGLDIFVGVGMRRKGEGRGGEGRREGDALL